jgi:hypothetical protein
LTRDVAAVRGKPGARKAVPTRDEFLRNMAGFTGLGAGCEYAVGFRRHPMG